MRSSTGCRNRPPTDTPTPHRTWIFRTVKKWNCESISRPLILKHLHIAGPQFHQITCCAFSISMGPPIKSAVLKGAGFSLKSTGLSPYVKPAKSKRLQPQRECEIHRMTLFRGSLNKPRLVTGHDG